MFSKGRNANVVVLHMRERKANVIVTAHVPEEQLHISTFVKESHSSLESLAPDHLVDNTRVGLNDLNNLSGNILIRIIGHGSLRERALLIESNRGANGIDQASLIDAGKRKARLYQAPQDAQ